MCLKNSKSSFNINYLIVPIYLKLGQPPSWLRKFCRNWCLPINARAPGINSVSVSLSIRNGLALAHFSPITGTRNPFRSDEMNQFWLSGMSLSADAFETCNIIQFACHQWWLRVIITTVFTNGTGGVNVRVVLFLSSLSILSIRSAHHWGWI